MTAQHQQFHQRPWMAPVTAGHPCGTARSALTAHILRLQVPCPRHHHLACARHEIGLGSRESPSQVMRGRHSARQVGSVSSPGAPDGYSLRRGRQAVKGVVMGAERDRVAGFGRLEDGLLQAGEWYRWGPYVSERQWGTVREDYSADGNAWDYLPHDHA